MGFGVALTVFGLTIRFVAAPVALGIVAFAIGLRSDTLCIAILQVLFNCPSSYLNPHMFFFLLINTMSTCGLMKLTRFLFHFWSGLKRFPLIHNNSILGNSKW